MMTQQRPSGQGVNAVLSTVSGQDIEVGAVFTQYLPNHCMCTNLGQQRC